MNWEAWAKTQAEQIAELRREVKNLRAKVWRLTASRDRWRTQARLKRGARRP